MSDNLENQEDENKIETPESEVENPTEENLSPLAENELEKMTRDLAESKEKYLRLYADFENFRRRTAKEKIDTIMNASEGLIKDLLPILDDCERAKKSIENSDDVTAIKEGIDLIFNKIQKTLEGKGLKAIEAKEKDFDVELHECITQFEAGEDKKGKVIDEVEKGYYLNEKVIRYSKVVVGS